jgi:uncharacterized membrane protein YqaE (UPF0057 family)
MKKITARLLLLLMILSSILPLQAATVSEPVPATSTKPAGTPDKETVTAAIKDFKNLSRKERRARIKEAKKAFKEYRANKKMRDDGDVELLLLVILAILLPPLAVFLKEGEINVKFWISLILSLLVFLLWPLWLIAVAYALLVVFDVM